MSVEQLAHSSALQKPNALIAMRPTRGRLTVIARKVYNAILFQTQQALLDDDDGRGGDGFFEAPLRVLLSDARIDSNSGKTLENVKRYLEEMQATQVDWLSISAADRLFAPSGVDGEEVLFDSSGLLYRSKVVRRDGALWVKWRLPEEIVVALSQRENVLWTRLQLQTLAKLGSYCAVALYEICSRYKTFAGGVTARQSIEWWADALSRAPEGGERREWRKFKAEQLKPAIDEINASTDIEIELIEHKKGRAVAEAQFTIRRVARKELDAKPAPLIDLTLFERARKCGLSDEQTTDLSRRFSDERVRSKLRELEARLNMKDLPKIESVLGYFKTILKSGDAPSETVADLDTSAAAPQMSEKAVRSTSAPAAATLAREEQYAVAHDQIKKEIDALSSSEREELIERAMKRFLESPACTTLLRQRIEQHRYDSPQLAAVVRNFYAEEKHGAGWRDWLAAT
jgi:hypothetical protein